MRKTNTHLFLGNKYSFTQREKYLLPVGTPEWDMFSVGELIFIWLNVQASNLCYNE